MKVSSEKSYSAILRIGASISFISPNASVDHEKPGYSEPQNSRADSRLAHYARSDPHAFYAHVDVFNRSNGVHTPPVTRPQKIKDREQ